MFLKATDAAEILLRGNAWRRVFNGQLLDAFKIQRGVRLDCVLLWTVLFFFRKVLQNFVEGILYLLP